MYNSQTSSTAALALHLFIYLGCFFIIGADTETAKREGLRVKGRCVRPSRSRSLYDSLLHPSRERFAQRPRREKLSGRCQNFATRRATHAHENGAQTGARTLLPLDADIILAIISRPGNLG